MVILKKIQTKSTFSRNFTLFSYKNQLSTPEKQRELLHLPPYKLGEL